MLKSLGLGKKKSSPVSDDLVRKHREQSRIHGKWRSDCERIRSITLSLEKTYSKHKGDFALGRYEELKDMIKQALEQYQQVMQDQKENPTSGEMSSKYGGEKKKGGMLTKLRQGAASLAGKTSGEDETRDETPSRLSPKEMQEEIHSMRREVLKFKVDFRGERDKLEVLSKEYQDSKKYAPPQRFPVMKQMVKVATRQA